MSISANTSFALERSFDAVDMAALNAKAEMLARFDNKYIVGAEILEDAAEFLRRHFDILEVDGRRSFSYENCYFDGPAWQSYFDHHQGRRKRAKVRMRKYIEAELCFVEIKLKDRRGMTVKRRLPCDAGAFGILDGAAHDYIGAAYREMYLRDFPYSLSRTLDTRYTRTTLVAKGGGERITIDSHLAFFADGANRSLDERFYILETKSANGNGLADQILRTFRQHPVKHCSKYCTGMIAMHAGLKHNVFLPALRKLGGLLDPAIDS
jgi:hypothetical protein